MEAKHTKWHGANPTGDPVADEVPMKHGDVHKAFKEPKLDFAATPWKTEPNSMTMRDPRWKFYQTGLAVSLGQTFILCLTYAPRRIF